MAQSPLHAFSEFLLSLVFDWGMLAIPGSIVGLFFLLRAKSVRKGVKLAGVLLFLAFWAFLVALLRGFGHQ
jgi:hypothetical protein